MTGSACSAMDVVRNGTIVYKGEEFEEGKAKGRESAIGWRIAQNHIYIYIYAKRIF